MAYNFDRYNKDSGYRGYASVRSFRQAEEMIRLCLAPERGNMSAAGLAQHARERLEEYHRSPCDSYLELAHGASLVLLRLEYGNLVDD